MKIEEFKLGTWESGFKYKYFVPSKINHPFSWNDDVINFLLEKASFLFSIITRNMFNAKYPQKRFCDNNPNLYVGEHSYITFVKWNDFCDSP